MLIPIKCFTCGKEISSLYRHYEREVRKKAYDRESRKKNTNTNDVIYLTKVNTDKTAEGEVLDSLNLDKMCCRRHLLTHVEIE